MARITKSISLNSDLDIDILNKLESISNISDYIKELIREDIKGNSINFTKNQKKEIEKIIMEILNKNDFTINKDNSKDVKKELSEEQSNALDTLLNMQ